MALPVILVNSATGSDSAASGAGPATALTGSAAATSGDGLTVTLDGSPDLSGVATDGSHVIYLADATAGARNFGKITAKDDGADTVTVSDAFGLSLTGKAWAIGGKRDTIAGTESKKLIENNGASGDAMPGWVIEMESGHTETIAATTTFRRAGNATSGPIILRGASGAATRPILTFSNNGNAFAGAVAGWWFRDFEMQNSNATKTASVAFAFSSGSGRIVLRNLKISDSTNKFWKIITQFNNGTPFLIKDCYFGNAASIGLDHTGGAHILCRIENTIFFSCGSHAISFAGSSNVSYDLSGCVFAYNTGDGINWAGSSNAPDTSIGLCVDRCVFHGNGGDGIEITSTSSQASVHQSLRIANSEFTYNGAYGISLSGAGITDALMQWYSQEILNCGFYGNTTAATNPAALAVSEGAVTADPAGGSSSATKDYAGTSGGLVFQVAAAHRAKGYPLGGTLPIGGSSGSAYSYGDIGAAQHADPAGSGGGNAIIGSGIIIPTTTI